MVSAGLAFEEAGWRGRSIEPLVAPARRGRLIGAPAAILVALVAGIALIAGWEWHRVFGWGPVVGKVVPAAVLPAVASWAANHRRLRSLPVTVLPSLAALLGLLALQGSLGSLAGGIVNGWAQLLAQPLPAAAAPGVLVLPTVTVWLSALTGTELALRASHPLIAVVPPLGAYGLALLFGIGGSGSRLWPSAIVLALCLAAAGVVTSASGDATAAGTRPLGPKVRPAPGRAAGGRRGERRGQLAGQGRRAVEVAGCAILAAAVAVWVGPSLPGVKSHAPYDPRAGRVQPTQPATAVNPLAELSAWAASPGQVLFDLRSSRPVDLRLAVLDSYDPGIGWTLGEGEQFQPAGKDLPGGGARRGAVTVTETVTVADVFGAWLPSADRPVQVTGAHVLFDARTGILVAKSPLPAGGQYQVRSVVAPSSPSCRLSAVVAPPGKVAVPSDLVNVALSLTAGATSPCARAQALATGLRDAYRFDTKAPSGSNIQILRDFLLGSRDNQGALGTSEQFASAYALLGRAVGLSTRVVVGFRSVGHPGISTPLRAGDAQAWPEVDFAGLGWVAFEPTPPANQAAHRDKPIEGSTGNGAQAKANPAGNGAQPVEAAPRLPRTARHRMSSPWSAVGLVAGIVIGVVAAGFGGLMGAVALVRRRRRRKRRLAADCRARVLGAWKDSIDTLADAGMDADPTLTADQVVAAGASRLGGRGPRDLAELGTLLNAAVYGPLTPDESAAARAWAYADRVAEVGLAGLSRGDRLRRAVDLRVLVGSR